MKTPANKKLTSLVFEEIQAKTNKTIFLRIEKLLEPGNTIAIYVENGNICDVL